LKSIPHGDQKKLETLFHHMMTGDYFACTLFGDKPMTFQEFHDDPWKMSSQCMVCPYHHYYLDEGWQTWNKYRSLFPSEKFIFTKIPSKSGYKFIILINKEAFEKVFEENRDIFEQALAPSITCQQILQDFEAGRKTFSEILNDHEGLVGIVLGYGREGSLFVFRDTILSSQILKKSLHPLAPPCAHEKLVSKGMQNHIKMREKRLSRHGIKWHQLASQSEDVEDPYEELNQREQIAEIFYPAWQENFVDVLPPNFFSIKNSEEKEQLSKNYAVAMQLSRQIFKEKSFLVGFLEQYCKKE